jgi:metal-responsive CopG/Arc/MetJ family transcriptional regulator
MRKKIPDKDKRKTISVTLHPEIVKLLEKYEDEKDVNKSKLIEDLLKKYLKEDE